MSQKKVDRYKNTKSNRSKTARKEKLIDRLEILAWVMIAVAMVGWIGYSAYVKISSKQASTVVQTAMDTSALDDYLDNLSAESEEDVTEDADTSESDEAETEEVSDSAESTETGTDSSETAETEEDSETADSAEEDAEETSEATAAAETDTASYEEDADTSSKE